MRAGLPWALAALATLASSGCGRNDNEPTPLLVLTLGTYRLTTSLEGASCVECVMPKEFLEQIVLDMLVRAGHGVSAVDIYDPREDPNWVAPPEH